MIHNPKLFLSHWGKQSYDGTSASAVTMKLMDTTDGFAQYFDWQQR